MRSKKIGNIEVFIFLGLAFILGLFNIRFCPFFNIFKIPCPGCGLTRAAMNFIKGNIRESFQYHILGIPIVLCILLYILLYMFKKNDIFDCFLWKHRKIVFIITILLTIFVEIRNIYNPFLY